MGTTINGRDNVKERSSYCHRNSTWKLNYFRMRSIKYDLSTFRLGNLKDYYCF